MGPQITRIKDKNNLLPDRHELNCRGMNPGLIEAEDVDQNSDLQLTRRHH
jgi:hypothetical protein